MCVYKCYEYLGHESFDCFFYFLFFHFVCFGKKSSNDMNSTDKNKLSYPATEELSTGEFEYEKCQLLLVTGLI